jgi:SAM-dependent methyltransferase
MTNWNEGAIIDIPARPRFHREATPIWLVTACALLGARAPSLSKPFRYADLGCGAGFTALTVAATCPRAEVWGFDFNPANIEIARDLAEQAGLGNIRFMEISFEAMAALPPDQLPQFDFMIAEAVLSVVSAENRSRIQTLIQRHLRSGGLAYLGYNADTGWTEFKPLQSLMRMLYESGTDASDFAISRGFETIERLKTGGANYFTRNPGLQLRIPEIRRQPASDLAHELLNQEWHPLMFSDVAEAMAEAKCDFIGRATLRENIAWASVPPAVVPLLDEAPSIRIRETMQDIAAVTQYRRDIYRRGMTFMQVAEHIAQLEALTVAALDRGPLAVLGWREQVSDPAGYELLLRALREGPLTVAKARELGTPADRSVEEAADSVALLIGAGHAHPVMPPLVAREAAPAVARLNDAIIDAITRGGELEYLVSPVLGTAVEITAFEALTIGALQYGGDPGDLDALIATVHQAMRLGGRSVVRNGVAVTDEGEARAALRDVIAGVLENRVPLFRELGMLRA